MSARLGVLFFNLGGPERLEDVKPFLVNLFSDPEIIRIRSPFLRKLVAWWIATTRRRLSESYYAKIGGGSPLRRLTEAQAEALERALAACGVEARVYVGMQCWAPTIDDAVDRIALDGIERLVVLPLYPQFSLATTGSALHVFEAALARRKVAGLDRRVIRAWHDDPGYVRALAATIAPELAAFPDPGGAATHVVYSAHSVPQKYIEEGDPYLEHTQRTFDLVEHELGGRHRSTLAFQSKVGPVKWLEPSTNDVIAELGKQGAKQLLIVPISFVSDHIETLYEIDILYKGLAAEAGIPHFRRAPSLNVAPPFVEALRDIVIRAAR
ncbi:MAG: ferrochelatase [Candidatus Binatia bacterium]